MPVEKRSVRDGFGAALLELGAQQPDVVALSADLMESVRLHKFAEKYPERFFEVGVAEQNLIGVAAGLAAEGYTAFAGSFAAFSPGRTYDQIRVSVCYGQRNVKIVGGHAGLTVGEDGATHQMLEDLAMMRALPKMRVLIPADYSSAHFLTHSAALIDGPTYLRLSRLSVPDLLPKKFEPSEPVVLHQGKDTAIVFCGILGARAIQLAKLIETQTGTAPSILALTQLKPWNESVWLKTLSQYKVVISLEEHQQMGGMGSALAELLSSHSPRPLESIGVQDTFGESGEAEALLDAYGFAPQAMLERVGQFLKRHQVL